MVVTHASFTIHCFSVVYSCLFNVIMCLFNCSSPISDTAAAAAAAESLQSCPTLCDPIDSSPPGSTVPGILQERTLEWVAISFSNAWKWKVKVKSLNRVWLFLTPWTAAHQAPPSVRFSRQESWSGLPLLCENKKSGYIFIPIHPALQYKYAAEQRHSNY